MSDMQLVALPEPEAASAGALNAKVGVMLLVNCLTTSTSMALDGRYGDVSQQTQPAPRFLCYSKAFAGK